MTDVKFSWKTDPGETTDEITNEDYILAGPEKNMDAILLLDGTSGTAGDFGAKDQKKGGRVYVETLSHHVEEIIEEKPGEKPQGILKEAVSRTWDSFQETGKKRREKYFSGEDVTYPTAETIPGAVGCLVKWSNERIEVMHVGDVETYVVKKSGETDFFCNRIHQRFDEIFEEKITELREKGVENPGKHSEVREFVNKHRCASGLPGTYPQFQFNPLEIEKLGEKKIYEREKVEKILIGSDGATDRIRELFDLDKNQVPDFVEKRGVEKSIAELREKENEENLDKLKNSDDAALAVIEFQIS